MAVRPAQEDTSQGPKWTVMVFMGADNLAGTDPLLDVAEADLAEMAAVGSGGGFNLFVQVHAPGLNKRDRVTTDTKGIASLRDVPAGEENPANGQALQAFIDSALKETTLDLQKTYGDPATLDLNSMLVLWGHAYEFAIGHALTMEGTIDALDFAELSRVLRTLQERAARYGATRKQKLDILGFDACELATVEMACQLSPFACYLLGSQIGIPIPGWPYDRILDRLRNPYGGVMGPAEFGSYIVRRFCESYIASRRTVSLTLLDLQRVPELFAHGEVFALTLMNAIRDPATRDELAELFLRSQTVEDSPYVDVATLCLNLVRQSPDVFAAEAARALGDFLISPRAPLVGKSVAGGGRPFVVEHGRNAGQTARLNGISLYAPHVAPNLNFEAVRPLYQNFDFARETRWSDLVHALATES